VTLTSTITRMNQVCIPVCCTSADRLTDVAVPGSGNRAVNCIERSNLRMLFLQHASDMLISRAAR